MTVVTVHVSGIPVDDDYPPVDGSQPCAQTDPDAWFPDGQGGSAVVAKRMCRPCPFREPCLRYALNHPDLIGVWGGTSPRERRVMRAGRQVAA